MIKCHNYSITGKNLIGTFYQPKLVVSDVSLLKSLPRREIICGYAEILKHAIIKDKKFFNWLKSNTHKILMKDEHSIMKAIKRSIDVNNIMNPGKVFDLN